MIRAGVFLCVLALAGCCHTSPHCNRTARYDWFKAWAILVNRGALSYAPISMNDIELLDPGMKLGEALFLMHRDQPTRLERPILVYIAAEDEKLIYVLAFCDRSGNYDFKEGLTGVALVTHDPDNLYPHPGAFVWPPSMAGKPFSPP